VPALLFELFALAGLEPQSSLFFYLFIFLVVLGFEFRAYTLSYSTCPILC
jgi:hypothetical protein